jgi:3-isopropylmalate/(R)-2-methylmalate dehydratase small subunit
MKTFITLTDTLVPLPIENVDTDQIIPSRFLKATSKEGFGEALFRDWRFDAEGRAVPTFILNDPLYKGSILVAGKNFGSGSSREHAAWAIAGYGFRVIVSSFFADIFKNNAMNTGLLPIVISEEFLAAIFSEAAQNPQTTLTIDLPGQTLSLDAAHRSEPFPINAYKKECFLKGFDDIDYLLSKTDAILQYEKSRPL